MKTSEKNFLERKTIEHDSCVFEGKYSDVYEDLVYYLRSMETPLIILDEGIMAYMT